MLASHLGIAPAEFLARCARFDGATRRTADIGRRVDALREALPPFLLASDDLQSAYADYFLTFGAVFRGEPVPDRGR